MKSKYGEFSENQIAKIKSEMRKQIYFLILIVDPLTSSEYEDIDVRVTIESMLIKFGGLNSLLLEPAPLVKIMADIEAALIEYTSPDFDVSDFRHSKYRKLVLDAGNEVLKIEEV